MNSANLVANSGISLNIFFLHPIGSPGDELASPGEYNAINEPIPENGHQKISFQNFQPPSTDHIQKISYESIPSDQTPIIQIENQAQNAPERISNSVSNPTIPSSVNTGPKRKNGKASGNGNGGKASGNGSGNMSPNRKVSMGNIKKIWPHNRGMSVIDADPHHALSPSYNIDEDAVPFTFSRPGIDKIFKY